MPLLLFFLSGACALVYQVVWVRQLLLVVGTTTAAVSTVLAVFMAGLGLGAWVFGRRADRTRTPLKLYAYLELGVGLYALLLPALLSAATPAYVSLARHLAGRPAALSFVRVGLGFLLLLMPTVFMGGTLPVLVKYVSRGLGRLAGDLGVLYGANLLGAVAGSLAAGFVLIRALGIQGATMAAVLGNLCIGLAALYWAERVRVTASGAGEPAAPTASGIEVPQEARPMIWIAVFLSGFLSIAYEVLWTRILIFTFGSTVYSFTLILATFLAGLALGSRLLAALGSGSHPLRVLAGALVSAGVTALLLAPISTRSADLVQALSLRLGVTGTVFLASTALSAALVMLVPATLMGIVFPLGMWLLVDDLARAGRRVGAAYVVNTAGSVAGSLCTGFAVIPVLGLKRGLVLLATAQVLLGWAFLRHAEWPAPRRRQVLAGSAVLLLAAFAVAARVLAGPNPFDPLPQAARARSAYIEAHRDAVAASVSIVNYPNQGRALRIDGFEASSDIHGHGAGYMAMMTHIPMLLHPQPRRLLVICFGTGTTAGAGLLHPGTTVDVVDINPAVFDFAPYFEVANHGVAHDPRARLIADDGRNFLLTTRERYDVITAEPMPPRFAGMVNLYSREYYALARSRLRPGGFVVQWLPIHLITFDETLRILKTVHEVFAETTLWLHSNTGIIVARDQAPIRIDFARLAPAFAPGPLRDDLERFGVGDPADFAGLHAFGPEAARLATARAPSITDDHPSLEFHRVRPPLREFRGSLDLEEGRSRELIHRLRLADEAPVVNATAGDAARIAEARKVRSHVELGDLNVYWGLGRPASIEYEAAVQASADPSIRAALMLRAAASARQERRVAP
jgi:spermidine synthase